MIINFKPSKAEKESICNYIKCDLEGKEYYLMDILYDAYTGIVKVVDPNKTLEVIFNNHIFYNNFRHFAFDGDISSKEIENKIFCR